MYLLKVDKSDIDKVMLELIKHNIVVIDVFRSLGHIHVKTENRSVLEKMCLIKCIKKEGILPQLLQL